MVYLLNFDYKNNNNKKKTIVKKRQPKKPQQPRSLEHKVSEE